MTANPLPFLALSVRQPWAWAIVAGHKPVENRSAIAVATGKMEPGPIAIHAAQGMTQHEYEDAAGLITALGIACPRPDQLVRGAIIGGATVTGIVEAYSSTWFSGPRGLVLTDAFMVEPIPAVGQLGYFPWSASYGVIAKPLPWMTAWPAKAARPTKVKGAPLFDHLGKEG